MPKKGVPSSRGQSGKYHEFNPDDTARGGLKTPMYGSGKISHMKPDYQEPGTPPNTMGLLHVNKGKKGK